MNGVFLDTVGMLAVWDSTDQWHHAAEEAFGLLLKNRVPLISTSYILIECGNAASRRPYRSRVNELRVSLQEDGLLFDPTDEELDSAWASYDFGDAGNSGIVDQISFIVMRRLGIKQAFTNDWHFKAAGFETLF